MKTLALPLAALSIVTLCGTASAQDVVQAEPVPLERPTDSAQSRDGRAKWQSMSQAVDPRWAVVRNAQLRGTQRRSRLAAMKWFGLSNSRPAAAATPFTGVYSNTWTGSPLQPYAWSSRPSNTVIYVQPERRLYER